MKVLKTVLLIIIAAMIAFFKAYVLLDVSKLWNLGFITYFSLFQVYIIISIFNLLTHKASEDEDLDTIIKKGYNGIWSTLIYSFIFWGGSYLLHYFN